MKNGKMRLSFQSENLAVPEVRTGEDLGDSQEGSEPNRSIQYDNLAVPEIHTKSESPKEPV